MIDIALLIGIVIALTQMIKQFDVSKKYLPVVSLAFGLLAGVFYLDGPLSEQILYGMMIGLSASGLFDQTKIVTKEGDK